jgi:hypothetical protein
MTSLPIELLSQIQNIHVDEIKSNSQDGMQPPQNLSDTIAVEMVAPLMSEPMTQQQRFVVSQIMKYPDQMQEIIEAAMAAGIKPPVLKDVLE